MTSVPALADPPLGDSPALVSLYTAYSMLYTVVDPEEREAARQYYLFMIWLNGGSPWKLDPTWQPPMGGMP